MSAYCALLSRSLGSIFGEGNLGTAFQNFKEEHSCSKFCRFYELEPLANDSELSLNKPSQESPPTSTMEGAIHPTRNEVSYHSEVVRSKVDTGGVGSKGKGKQRARTPLFISSSNQGDSEQNVEPQNSAEA